MPRSSFLRAMMSSFIVFFGVVPAFCSDIDDILNELQSKYYATRGTYSSVPQRLPDGTRPTLQNGFIPSGYYDGMLANPTYAAQLYQDLKNLAQATSSGFVDDASVSAMEGGTSIPLPFNQTIFSALPLNDFKALRQVIGKINWVRIPWAENTNNGVMSSVPTAKERSTYWFPSNPVQIWPGTLYTSDPVLIDRPVTYTTFPSWRTDYSSGKDGFAGQNFSSEFIQDSTYKIDASRIQHAIMRAPSTLKVFVKISSSAKSGERSSPQQVNDGQISWASFVTDGKFHELPSLEGGKQSPPSYWKSPLLYPTDPSLSDYVKSESFSFSQLIILAKVDSSPPPPPDTCNKEDRPLAGTGQSLPRLKTTGLSSADNFTLNFLHEASDIARSSAGSCSPCGQSSASGGLASLVLTRHHGRFDREGLFGNGVTLGFDKRLIVSQVDIRWQDTSLNDDEVLAKIPGGVVTPLADQRSQSIVLLDDAGQSVASISQAQRIAITGWDHRTYLFEMGPTDIDRSQGRLLRITEGSGAVTAIDWSHARAALAGDIEATAKWWKPSRLTAPNGEQALFTCVAQPLDGLYPIKAITLPGGAVINYTYGTLVTVGGMSLAGLRTVGHPDGTTSSFSAAVEADGNVAYAIVDPAAEGAEHQRKTVVYSPPGWIDPWRSEARPWRVRAVRNGAGEIVYRNQRIATSDELWTVVQAHGEVVRLVASSSGRLLRTDRATSAVVWASDPATWSWETIGSYTINGLNRVAGSSDALGRSTAFKVDPVTAQGLGETRPDGSSRTIVRDAAGFVISETDALGFVTVGSSRVDLQACKLEYSIVSPK